MDMVLVLFKICSLGLRLKVQTFGVLFMLNSFKSLV